jgi:hypothetical protein
MPPPAVNAPTPNPLLAAFQPFPTGRFWVFAEVRRAASWSAGCARKGRACREALVEVCG